MIHLIDTSHRKSEALDGACVPLHSRKQNGSVLLGYHSMYTSLSYICFPGPDCIYPTAICRCELSDLPKHKDTRTIVIRILKIVEPVGINPEIDIRIW